MSNFQYDKECCQKEREHKQRVKHKVRNPHCYVTQISDHEKCIENLSNLNLKQGTSVRSSCMSVSSDKSRQKSHQLCRQSLSNQHQRQTNNCFGCVNSNLANVASTSNQTTSKAGSSSKSKTKTNTKSITNTCYPVQRKVASTARCHDNFVWQEAKYVKDECGSGIVPLRLEAADPRRVWCTTPLTMYQSTIGELARRMLCNEVAVPKRVNQGPPCNMCEHVMPMCKGYYRKYECRRNCEEDHAVVKNGKKVYRDPIQQYWMPCLTTEEKREYDLSKDADHNVYLGKKLKRKIDEKIVCW